MRFSKLNSALLGVALCAGPVLAQTQRPVIHSSSEEATKATRLFDEMKTDAQEIDTHAMQLEKLAKDPNTQWAQFDQEWNEIKPVQEMLETHMWALDGMRASLTDAQRSSLDQTKQAAARIALRTRELLKNIDRPNENVNTAGLRADAQALARNAETVAHASALGA